MAHIPEGILATPVLLTGAVVSVTLLSIALRRLPPERVPQTAFLSAAFFVASLISVPVGASSVHLLLNGLMGMVLGWSAVPAIVVALLLQALFFGFGGIVALGVNAMNMAIPALLCAFLLRPALHRATPRSAFWLGMAAGAIGVAGTGLLLCLSIGLSGPELLPAAKVIFVVFLPLLVVESVITGFALGFVDRVAPELLSLRQVRYD